GRAADGGEAPVLGVLPAGRDNEFFRQFGLPMEALGACRHLAGERVYPIDVGTVTCAAAGGGTDARCFVNVGEVGFGADMTAWEGAEGSGRRRFLAFWRAVLTANR